MKRLILTKENRLASVRDVNPKTQIREVIVPQFSELPSSSCTYRAEYYPHPPNVRPCTCGFPEPKHQVGDIVGLPEPYKVVSRVNFPMDFQVIYQDDNKRATLRISRAEYDKWCKRKKPYMKTQARFMYDSLIRHFVKVTKVRVERNNEGLWDWVYDYGISTKEVK